MTVGDLSYSIRRGVVLFVAAGASLTFTPLDGKQEILMYRAFCELQS